MICPYCGESLDLALEVWGHEWQPLFCCERLCAEWQEHFERYGSDEDVYALFQTLSGQQFDTRGLCEGLIDYRLQGEVVTGGEAWQTVKAFIGRHHRHHKKIVGWYFGVQVWNGPTLVGVASVGRPVARALPKTVIEVNRCCTRGLSGLEKHAASKIYALAAQEAKRRKYAQIITYTFVDESGVSLKAAGWTIDKRVKGRHWSCPSRPRTNEPPKKDKYRWSRRLQPS